VNESFKRLDQLRRKKGISLKEMGEICGISPQGVQTWKNAREVPVGHLAKLAAYFGVTIDSLIADADGAARSMAREAPPEYGKPPAELCRYPADCDLKGELHTMREELGDIRTLLVSLLAEERSRNAVGHDRKAG